MRKEEKGEGTGKGRKRSKIKRGINGKEGGRRQKI